MFGLGWIIDIPYITRLNKNGSDKFFTANNFTSSLDGELVSGDSVNYKARSDGGEMHKYNFSNNTWTVTDKKGVVYKFGSTASEQQTDPLNPSHVYKWMLQEIRDKNDNFVRYEYYKDAGQI